MNKTIHQTFSPCKAAVFSSIMCALAMLVLVVSCPLKRMLQSKVVSNSSAVANSKHGAIIQPAGKYVNNSPGCFLVTDKIFFSQPELSGNQPLPSPLYLPAINEHSVIDIHFLQSGLHLNDFNAASNHYAELPLFLQHMRLLI